MIHSDHITSVNWAAHVESMSFHMASHLTNSVFWEKDEHNNEWVFHECGDDALVYYILFLIVKVTMMQKLAAHKNNKLGYGSW